MTQPSRITEKTKPSTAQIEARRRNFRRRALPVLGATVLSLCGAVYAVAQGSGSHGNKIPTYEQVMNGDNGLKDSTPTLTEEQLRKWPVQETVTVTGRQAADGASAVAGAIDHEVFDGGPKLSNNATATALENLIEDEADAQHHTHGHTGLRDADQYEVPNIHPNIPNVVTGGNTNIPPK